MNQSAFDWPAEVSTSDEDCERKYSAKGGSNASEYVQGFRSTEGVKERNNVLVSLFSVSSLEIIACIIKFIVLKNVPVYQGDFKSPLGNTIKVCMYVLMS